MQNITLFWVLSFCVRWRCSAGSQIFFLDKESETCQKISAPQKYLLSQENRKIHKSDSNHVFIYEFVWFLYIISRYSEFWDFVSDEGALRGLRYFSLTNNLRLVKKISAPQKYLLSQENRKIHKMTRNHAFIYDFVWFYTQYHVILSFEFWSFLEGGSFIIKHPEIDHKTLEMQHFQRFQFPVKKSDQVTNKLNSLDFWFTYVWRTSRICGAVFRFWCLWQFVVLFSDFDVCDNLWCCFQILMFVTISQSKMLDAARLQ